MQAILAPQAPLALARGGGFTSVVYRFYRYRSCFVPVSIRRTNDRLLRTGTVPAHSGVFLPVLSGVSRK